MRLIFFFCVLFAHHSLISQTIPPPSPVADNTNSVAIIADQDFFAPQNEDRNYTMGFSINLTGIWCDKNWLVIPWLRKGIDRFLGLRNWHQRGETYITGMQLYDGAFTPLIIDSPTPITDDRPFANILGLSSSKTSLMNGDLDLQYQSSISTRFAIGILGTRVAESVQSYVHKNHIAGSQRPVPLGWPTQISNGGEPTALYQIQYLKPIFEESATSSQMKTLQGTLLLEANLGYYTNMATGITLRIGRFSSPFWLLNNSGMSVANQAASKSARPSRYPEFHFYTSFRGRAVMYNALLQGQFKHNDFELNKNQINRFIFEGEFGLNVHYRFLTILYAPYIMRTAETNLTQKRNHYWGSLAAYVQW